MQGLRILFGTSVVLAAVGVADVEARDWFRRRCCCERKTEDDKCCGMRRPPRNIRVSFPIGFELNGDQPFPQGLLTQAEQNDDRLNDIEEDLADLYELVEELAEAVKEKNQETSADVPKVVNRPERVRNALVPTPNPN